MTSYRPYQHIERRKSRQIHVGRVPVGGDAPITVQTMTNTLTSDAAATIAQIRLAEMAGVDIVRVNYRGAAVAPAMPQPPESSPTQTTSFPRREFVPPGNR